MTLTTFADLGVPNALVEVLAADGKTEAFPIQADTLPDTLDGADVLGRGRTGSGKTLAFSIPLVAGLADLDVARTPGAPTGLVLAPTRELATQIADAVTPLAEAVGLRVTTVFGGVKQSRQEQALRRGADIVVACPGRLEDLMSQKIIRLDDVEITILDEADHMADLGFLPAVTRILASTPADGQRMLFSATLDNGVDKLVRRFLHEPVMHSVDDASSPVEKMTHHVYELADASTKNDVIRTLASGTGKRILFTRTKHQARKLAKKLTAEGIPAVDLHGNLSQAQRDRSLAAFGGGNVRVLVATDVAARGVHVDGIELVVHVDPPAEHKAYLHRSGRTARAGSAGDVVTLCLPEQRRDLRQLLSKAKISVTPQRVDATSEPVLTLVGERAAYVEPAPEQPAQQRQPRGPRRAGGQSGARNANRGGRGRGEQSGTGGSQGSRSRTGAPRRSAGGHPEGGAARSGATTRSGGTGRSGGAARSGGAGHSGGTRTRDAQAGGGARRGNGRNGNGQAARRRTSAPTH
ncbi:DEAD/DEAH box helicase [Gordonia sp. NB41Y]|uniref:DEAD/DEAH box helicase n=1 Tax=Gordonia sp. NB41Y TaxID=875808 RepID=UPI00273B2EC0|nr:DEAD/DEAH box helicase [Gordonia sp. NB41Y]WLP91706.1 DEAD/DEAH box helicase [Gordonia sp. NB41Y]